MLYIILMCTSRFIFFFFANDLLLAAYFIFILDYRNEVRQKSKFEWYFFSAKWVIKQQKQLATSTTHLAQELLMNSTRQWWFKKFCKGDENLEDKQCSGRPSKVDDQPRALIKDYCLTTIEEVAKELNIDPFYGSLAFKTNWKGKTW